MINKIMFEKVPCNLCGSNDFEVIYPARPELEKDKDLVKKFRSSGDELLIDPLVECKKCGLKFVNPRIKGNLIVDAYSAGDDPLFISQAESRERTFSKAIREITKVFGSRGKIVDIGTAGGSFLAAAKKQGWDVYGCEPNRWLANWGKKNYGIDIKPGTIFDQKYKKEFFDVLTLWDVIEHTPDPLKVLEESNRILKKNGLLIVNYPDINSWLARLMGRKWLFLTSVHLYYFTPRTIKAMLAKTGFKVVKIRPYFQTLEFGYLCFRAGSYSKILSKIGMWFARTFGLEHKQMPYWLGQTFIMARKV
ncbi:MAG: class I SAM-dependent methyltransferase [Nanoarchaeota archaeon]